MTELASKVEDVSQTNVTAAQAHPDVKEPSSSVAKKYNAVELCKNLQSLIVTQNKYLQILLSEEAFNSGCGDLYNSNIFGEDQSEIVNQLVSA